MGLALIGLPLPFRFSSRQTITAMAPELFCYNQIPQHHLQKLFLTYIELAFVNLIYPSLAFYYILTRKSCTLGLANNLHFASVSTSFTNIYGVATSSIFLIITLSLLSSSMLDPLFVFVVFLKNSWLITLRCKMLQDTDSLSGWCHHDSLSCQYEDTLKHLIQSSYPSSAISVNSISLKPTLLSQSFTHFRLLPITFTKPPSSFSPCVLVTQATTTKFSAAPPSVSFRVALRVYYWPNHSSASLAHAIIT